MKDNKKIISEYMASLAKKKWSKISKKKRSEIMKKVRNGGK